MAALNSDWLYDELDRDYVTEFYCPLTSHADFVRELQRNYRAVLGELINLRQCIDSNAASKLIL